MVFPAKMGNVPVSRFDGVTGRRRGAYGCCVVAVGLCGCYAVAVWPLRSSVTATMPLRLGCAVAVGRVAGEFALYSAANVSP